MILEQTRAPIKQINSPHLNNMVQVIVIKVLMNGKAAHLHPGSGKREQNAGNQPDCTFVFPSRVGLELQQHDTEHGRRVVKYDVFKLIM